MGTRLVSLKKKKFRPWITRPEILISLTCEWPTLPVVNGEIKEIISSQVSIIDIKTERKCNFLSPSEKFTAFIDH